MAKWLHRLGTWGNAVTVTGGVLTTNWVLAVSTLGGIATGVWALATESYLNAVISAGLAFVILIWTLNGIIWLRRQSKPSKPRMIFDYSYGISVDSLQLAIDTETLEGAFQIGLLLRNAAPAPLKYYVDELDVIIGDRTITDPIFTNRGGVIPRGGRKVFYYPPLSKEVLEAIKPRPKGKVRYKIRYGHPEDEYVRVASGKLDVSLRLDEKPGAVYLVESESDEEIKA